MTTSSRANQRPSEKNLEFLLLNYIPVEVKVFDNGLSDDIAVSTHRDIKHGVPPI